MKRVGRAYKHYHSIKEIGGPTPQVAICCRSRFGALAGHVKVDKISFRP